MTRIPYRRYFLLILVLPVIVAPLAAQVLYETVSTGRSARSHRFDVLHIAMNIRLNLQERTVIGTVEHRIRSLDAALRSIRLDAASNMSFDRVLVDGAVTTYRHYGDTLDVLLPAARKYNDTFVVSIAYRVVPKKGLYFIQPDSLRPNRREQVWTQGEDDDNHFWVPLYDYPNDRSTSEVKVTVPSSWKALSNGKFIGTTTGSDGAVTWHYRQEKPHASYLIMLAAGEYLVTRDSVDGVPLEYWTYPDMPDRVKPTFGRTPDVMRYFTKLIGVPYPWQKYAQIFIANFMYGGMENTTATTLNDFALVDERGLLDYNPDGLIAHELAHQWYGDLVTNRSWGHLWLHESFATYLAARYRGHRYGDDVFAEEIYENGEGGINSDAMNGRDPIALGKGQTPNIYDRGSRVLHMLNKLVGDEAFWRANKFYLERHGYGAVETNDFKIAFEDALGQNLDWFFNEWVYKAGYPVYRVEQSFDRDTLRLRVRQVQTRDSLTDLFTMPVPLEFHTASGIRSDTILVAREDETFSFAMNARPTFTIFDAGDAILKRVEFDRSEEEIVAQLRAPRMIDRLLAVKELIPDSTADATMRKRRAMALRDAFAQEGAPYVREEIVERIADLDPDAAADVMMRAMKDTAVAVRRKAADRAYVILDKGERARQLRALLNDRSYGVLSAALGMLAVTDTTGLEPVLHKLKGLRGRRDRLSTAWLNAVAVGRFNNLAEDVLEYTTEPYREETRSLAYFTLAKLTATTPAVRAAILRGLEGDASQVRLGAAAAARGHMDTELRTAIESLAAAATGEHKDFYRILLEEN